VLGLGPGAVYGALGLGLMLTYRGSGVVNLAFGAMAMYPTYVYDELRTSGQLVLPGVPGTHRLGVGTDAVLALLIALAVAAVLSLTTYAVVVRPLRRAPPLATVVAAVGITVVLQAVVALRFGADPRAPTSLLPQSSFSLAGRTLPSDRLYLVALLLVVCGAGTVLYRRTRFGLVSRGATEGETAVELLGYSAVRLGAANWVIGGVIGALFGILLAPIAGLSPGGYSLLVVPALVAALAGRFVSTAVTVAAGLTLGVVQSVATRVELPWDWLGPQTVRTVIPFVGLVAVLLVRGTPVPPRGDGRSARLPAAHPQLHPWRLAAAVFLTGSLAAVLLAGEYRSALAVTMIGALLCLSLVVLTGFTGQVSLAQMSFAGVAGFTLSRVTDTTALPFPVGALFAVAAASVCGLVVGLLAVRARGMTLAVMTLAVALVVQELVFRNLSNGILSTNVVPAPSLAGLHLGPTAADGTPRAAFGVFVALVLSAAVAAAMHLRRSSVGRRMLAVRANERAAAATGIHVGRTKVVAFGLSALLAGLAGTLLGYQQGALSEQSFAVERSLLVLAVAYLGGIGNAVGALVAGLLIPGGLVATLLSQTLNLGRYETLAAGVAVVFVALRNPEGVVSTVHRLWLLVVRR
jgi:branched-chain amino acid transport system permease protein